MTKFPSLLCLNPLTPCLRHLFSFIRRRGSRRPSASHPNDGYPTPLAQPVQNALAEISTQTCTTAGSTPDTCASGEASRNPLPLPDQPHNLVRRVSLPLRLPERFDADNSFDDQNLLDDRPSNQPLPLYISCRIQLVVNGKVCKQSPSFGLAWQMDKHYRQCVKFAEGHLRSALKKHTDLDWEFYRVSHQYRVYELGGQSSFPSASETDLAKLLQLQEAGGNNENSHNCIEDEHLSPIHAEDVPVDDAWAQKVPPKLAELFLQKKRSVFGLEMRLSYTTFRRHPVPTCSSDCAQHIKTYLEGRRVYTKYGEDQGDWFVPSRFLSAYFDKTLIHHLVDQYEWDSITNIDQKEFITLCPERPLEACQPSLDSFKDRQNFIQWIYLSGVRLLATTIQADLDMSFMWRLWIAGVEEANLPLTTCPKGFKRDPYDKFYGFQWKFDAHSFPDSQGPFREKGPQRISEKTIIPIFRRERKGSGTNAVVYRVCIHEDHHNFTPNRNEEFALKVLKRDDPGDTNAIAEDSVLRELARVDHSHLTPFYTSWFHGGQFQMLFPLAEHNLEEFLEEQPYPQLDYDKIRYLVIQMAGLASALDQIHNLKPPGQDFERRHGNLPHRPRTGVHFDLSLTNILVFRGGVMKISDFGTTRIAQIRSMGKSPPNSNFIGNLTYAAPDEWLRKKVSRPYDIFSLGCIFLEVILWASGKARPKAFSAARLGDLGTEGALADNETSQNQTSAFFEMTGNSSEPTAILKLVVRQRLAELKKWVEDQKIQGDPHVDTYSTILHLIKQMMKIDMNKRPPAAQVRSTLEVLIQQVKFEKCSPKPQNYPQVAMPSTMGETKAGDPSPRPDTSITQPENRLGPATSTYRRRGNSVLSVDVDYRRSSDISRSSPMFRESDIANTGSGVLGGDQIDVSTAHQLTITTDESGGGTPESPGLRSIFFQELQSEERPMPRNTEDSDPGRTSTP